MFLFYSGIKLTGIYTKTYYGTYIPIYFRRFCQYLNSKYLIGRYLVQEMIEITWFNEKNMDQSPKHYGYSCGKFVVSNETVPQSDFLVVPTQKILYMDGNWRRVTVIFTVGTLYKTSSGVQNKYFSSNRNTIRHHTPFNQQILTLSGKASRRHSLNFVIVCVSLRE